MTDYAELMRIFSVPRPSGSTAERRTAEAIRAWLNARGIAYDVQSFRLYPYFFESIGAWLIGSRTLLTLAVVRRWGRAAPLIAGVGLAGGTLDVALGRPVITWAGARRGENILVVFGPPSAARTLILAAHYDSKTEALDHRARAFFTSKLRIGIALTALLGVLGPLDTWLARRGSGWARLTRAAGVVLAAPLVALAWGLGANLLAGRFSPPSQGAVDNGAACAVLLGLAGRLAREPDLLRRTRVVLAFFTGEEVNMQGSRAYVRACRSNRSDPLSASCNLYSALMVNLELLGQDGDYLLWRRDGNALRQFPTSDDVNHLLAGAVAAVTGRGPAEAGLINSDACSFLEAGVPSGVFGSRDRRLGLDGLHRPSDNVARVALDRLPETVEILLRLIRDA